MSENEYTSLIDRINEVIENIDDPNLAEILDSGPIELSDDAKSVILPGRHDSIELNLEDFEYQYKELKSMVINQTHGRIETENTCYQIVSYSENMDEILELYSETSDYTVEVVSTDLVMLAAILKIGAYEKHIAPPESNYAIKITWLKPTNKRLDHIIEQFIFEVSALHSILIIGGGFYEEYWPEEIEITDQKIPLSVYSEGMQLFNAAEQTGDPEIRLLGFTKVFEYYGETVNYYKTKQPLRELIQSNYTADINDELIIDIIRLVKKFNDRKSDKDLIRNVFKTAVRLAPIHELLPEPLKIRAHSSLINPKSESDFLGSLATITIASRNQVAHAKSNYEPTGDECSWEDLHAFNAFLRAAALQVIRWHTMLPEKLRNVAATSHHRSL